MAILTKEAYLKQITAENPSAVGMLKSGYYEVVPCDCKEHHCRGWITRFSQKYVRKNTQLYNPELVESLTTTARAVKKKG